MLGGVQVSDIKRANGLLADSAMFAKDTLLIPTRPMPIGCVCLPCRPAFRAAMLQLECIQGSATQGGMQRQQGAMHQQLLPFLLLPGVLHAAGCRCLTRSPPAPAAAAALSTRRGRA